MSQQIYRGEQLRGCGGLGSTCGVWPDKLQRTPQQTTRTEDATVVKKGVAFRRVYSSFSLTFRSCSASLLLLLLLFLFLLPAGGGPQQSTRGAPRGRGRGRGAARGGANGRGGASGGFDNGTSGGDTTPAFVRGGSARGQTTQTSR